MRKLRGEYLFWICVNFKSIKFSYFIFGKLKHELKWNAHVFIKIRAFYFQQSYEKIRVKFYRIILFPSLFKIHRQYFIITPSKMSFRKQSTKAEKVFDIFFVNMDKKIIFYVTLLLTSNKKSSFKFHQKEPSISKWDNKAEEIL